MRQFGLWRWLYIGLDVTKIEYYNVIQAEIAVLHDKITGIGGQGHLYTAINVLISRLNEIKDEMSPEEQTFITLRDNNNNVKYMGHQ